MPGPFVLIETGELAKSCGNLLILRPSCSKSSRTFENNLLSGHQIVGRHFLTGHTVMWRSWGTWPLQIMNDLLPHDDSTRCRPPCSKNCPWIFREFRVKTPAKPEKTPWIFTGHFPTFLLASVWFFLACQWCKGLVWQFLLCSFSKRYSPGNCSSIAGEAIWLMDPLLFPDMHFLSKNPR